MTGRKVLLLIAAVLFLLMGISGFYRLMVGYPLSLGSLQFGQTLSFFIFIICVVISLILFKQAMSRTEQDPR